MPKRLSQSEKIARLMATRLNPDHPKFDRAMALSMTRENADLFTPAQYVRIVQRLAMDGCPSSMHMAREARIDSPAMYEDFFRLDTPAGLTLS